MFLLASLFTASRCPLTWVAGGLFTVMILIGVWPVSALIVFIGDRLSRPSGAGALADTASAFGRFAMDKAASELAYGTPVFGGDIRTQDPNTFRGSDIETIRNRRVRTTVLLAFGLAIGLPLSLALSRTNVDASGLPISPSRDELLARPEVQLIPAGGQIYNQQVDPASCSLQGEVYTDMSSPQPVGAVYQWYDQWLRAHAWHVTGHNPTIDYPTQPSVDVEYAKGPREKLALTVGPPQYAPAEGSGVAPPPPPGTHSTLQVHYTIEPYVAPSTSCLLYTSPSPRDLSTSRMPSSA